MSWAVKFEGVSKRYRGGGPRYGSLRHDLAQGFKRVGQLFSRMPAEPNGNLALEDVSFEVQPGESFAIVGPNGAGKTTALRIISRITYLTGGRVRVRGRVGALIEVGSGVHPELTARENIWLYGQILGMSKADVRRRFDHIVEFAELRHVLDTPVKMFSSGMQLRLGFAIASHLDPDVFVVDEALAVGDARFQAKCVARMTELVKSGRTVVFVSHNLPAVEAICSRGIFLLDGHVEYEGPTEAVLSRYLAWVESGRGLVARESDRSIVRVQSASCFGLDGVQRHEFKTGEGVEIRIKFASDRPLEKPHVNLGITDGKPGILVQCSMLMDGQAPASVPREWECTCRIKRLPLRPRLYQIYCDVYDGRGYAALMDWSQVSSLRIVGLQENGPVAVVGAALGGAVEVEYEWSVQ
jgi:lipopolysaccharide transport system ATP-binding protein